MILVMDAIQTAPNHSDIHGRAPKYRRKEAAQILGLTEEGLRTLERRRRGPAVHRIGRLVRYSIADLLDFIEKHREASAA